MLILSRKKDEKIIINDDIQIQIVDIKTDTVKLGIDAPKDVKIYRTELWDTIQTENKLANISDKAQNVKESLNEINTKITKKVQSTTEPPEPPSDSATP